MSNMLLGPGDEPRECGAIVAVHFGDYRRQECWIASGSNIGNWYPLGGESGRPKVATDPRTELEKLCGKQWRVPTGEIPLHPHWEDVLARGPVTLLVPGDRDAYLRGWRAGRHDLWQAMEEIAEEDPRQEQR